jgi:hypothetical protein
MSLCRNERARTFVARILTRSGTDWQAAWFTDMHFYHARPYGGTGTAETCGSAGEEMRRFQSGLSLDTGEVNLTPILAMWRIWWAPNNASKWHMGYNSAFEGLIGSVDKKECLSVCVWVCVCVCVCVCIIQGDYTKFGNLSLNLVVLQPQIWGWMWIKNKKNVDGYSNGLS